MIKSSDCDALGRARCQISIVNIVDDELNIEVNDDMRAAIMQAKISPRKPFGINRITINGYAMSVQDNSLLQMPLHVSGLEHPIKS